LQTIIALSNECNIIGANPKQCEIYLSAQNGMFQCGGTRNQLIPIQYINDDFCDCSETGYDEPGTSACSNGRFYCRNLGYRGEYVFSSWVNDGICDCCDGSDEWNNKNVQCKNTCREKAEVELKKKNFEYKKKT